MDAADFERVASFKWVIARSGRPAAWVASASGARIRVALSRFILHAPAGTEVDHENGHTLDNRRANLRLATHSENMRNRKSHAGRSTYKGVDLKRRALVEPESKKGGRPASAAPREWRARIWIDGRRVLLGMFATDAEAARAYDEAAMRHFGEFACVNFPSRGKRSARKKG